MKIQIAIISLLLLSQVQGAVQNLAHQKIPGALPWTKAVLTAADPQSPYSYWMEGQKQKNGMDFWNGFKATCATEESYDNTSDLQADSWASNFDNYISDNGGNGNGDCNTLLNNIAMGTTTAGFTVDNAFEQVPFAVIKCYEDFKAQLVKKPTTIGDKWLSCLKTAITGVGYDVDAGLIGQHFRRSYKKWTAADITQSTWDALVAANTDGKTYTNAAYAQCADKCETNPNYKWVDEQGTDKTTYQGIMPQQLHAKQLLVAKDNCAGNEMKADAKPQDAFDSAIGTAMNKCVDALELWEYNTDENKKMQCYRQCANPARPFAGVQAKTTSVDGEIRSEDGEYIIRKRTIIANYVGCIQKISTQTATAINKLETLPEVWEAASNYPTWKYAQNGGTKEESTLIVNADTGLNWQYCMQVNTKCQNFATWAMKDYEWAMDLPTDAEDCVKHCTKSTWVNGKAFDNNTPNNGGWTADWTQPEYAGQPQYAKMQARDQCIATLKSEWAVERSSWISGQRASGSLLIVGSVIALVFGLLA